MANNSTSDSELINSLSASAIHSAPESILWSDSNGKILYANLDALGCFGLSSFKDVVQNYVSDLIPELDASRLQQIWAQAQQNKASSMDCLCKYKGAQLVPAEIRLNLVRDGDQEYLVFYIRSITARNEAENLLHLVARTTSKSTGEDFFRVLVRSLADALGVRIVFVTECLDYPTTRVRNLAYWRDDIFVESTEWLLEGTPCDSVVTNGKACYYPTQVEELFAREKGRGVESYLGVPIFNAAGTQVIGHIALMDINVIPESFYIKAAFDIFCSRAGAEIERLQTTRRLQEQEKKYRLLVENQREFVVRMDDTGLFEFVSPSLCEAFSRNEQDLVGSRFEELLDAPDRDSARASWKSLIDTTQQTIFEHRAKTIQGWRWISWSFNPSFADNGQLQSVVSIGRDITERRGAQDKVRQTILELAHLSRLNSMGEMASAFAHEVNQPLCAILSFAQACQRIITNGSVDYKDLCHAIDRIAANADQAGKIIKQMRSYVKKEDVKHLPANIVQLVQDTLILSQAETRDANIAINFSANGCLSDVNVNATQIQQVILNLLRNATEAIILSGRTGGIDISARNLSSGMIQIEVVDDGPGIPEQILEKVFEPFVSSKQDGIGIGLSICKSIIESHGGDITVSNDSDRGARFRFSLPLVISENNLA